jgi:hypothetical protein
MMLCSVVEDTFHRGERRARREHIKSEEKNWDQSISPCLTDRRSDGSGLAITFEADRYLGIKRFADTHLIQVCGHPPYSEVCGHPPYSGFADTHLIPGNHRFADTHLIPGNHRFADTHLIPGNHKGVCRGFADTHLTPHLIPGNHNVREAWPRAVAFLRRVLDTGALFGTFVHY